MITMKNVKIFLGFFFATMFAVLAMNLIMAHCQAKAEAPAQKQEIILPEIEQLRIAAKLKDMQILDGQIQLLQTQIKAAQAEAVKLIDEAFTSRKLSRAEWDLDLQTFKFKAKTKVQ